jgi:Development and cell death domain
MTAVPSPSGSGTPLRVYIFECSSETYLGCIEKSVFGSNIPWPLQVLKGDFCLLHHYNAGSLFGLWSADSNGGRNLVPKAWNGKYPYQVRVTLASPKIIEVPKNLMAEFRVDPTVGRFGNVVEDQLATLIVESLKVTKS